MDNKNRRNDHWSADDAQRLEEYTSKGMTEAEIASVMGRTETAINVQKSKMKLTHRLPEYRITAPDGVVFSASSLMDFVAARLGVTEDFSLPVKRSRASMGLQWSLRSGRKWKGWVVEVVDEGSRKRSSLPIAERRRKMAPVESPRRRRWMCPQCGGTERSVRHGGRRQCDNCVPKKKGGPKPK